MRDIALLKMQTDAQRKCNVLTFHKWDRHPRETLPEAGLGKENFLVTVKQLCGLICVRSFSESDFPSPSFFCSSQHEVRILRGMNYGMGKWASDLHPPPGPGRPRLLPAVFCRGSRGSAAAFGALLDLRVTLGHFSLTSWPWSQPPPRLGESICSVLCGSP